MDCERFLTGVEEACGATRPRESPDHLFIAWEKAKDAGRGSNGHRVDRPHPRALANSPPSSRSASAGCPVRRSGGLGLTVDSFAFPVGWKDSFSGSHARMPAGAGYRTASRTTEA